MNEDYREFRSVGLLGEKLTGKKLSDDPEKQITNTPATTPGSSILGR